MEDGRCVTDLQCAQRQICEAGVCKARSQFSVRGPGSEQGCVYDDECEYGQICEALACVESPGDVSPCVSNLECDKGYVCRWDRCVLPKRFDVDYGPADLADANRFGTIGQGSTSPDVLIALFCSFRDNDCGAVQHELRRIAERAETVRIVVWPMMESDHLDLREYLRVNVQAALLGKYFTLSDYVIETEVKPGDSIKDFTRALRKVIGREAEDALRLASARGIERVDGVVATIELMNRALSRSVAPRAYVNGIAFDIDQASTEIQQAVILEQMRATSARASGTPEWEIVRKLTTQNNPEFARSYYGVLRAPGRRIRYNQKTNFGSIRVPVPKNRRFRPMPASRDWVSGRKDARVTLFGVLDPRGLESATLFYALTRLAKRSKPRDLRVVIRPWILPIEVRSLREARAFAGLSSRDAQKAWLDWTYVHGDDAAGAALLEHTLSLVPSRDRFLKRADAPATDTYLQTVLKDQVRMSIDGAPVLFLNGKRLDRVPSEKDLEFAVRRELERVNGLLRESPRARKDPYRFVLEATKSADLIGEVVHEFPDVGAARTRGGAEGVEALGTMTLFIDYRCPYSGRLLAMVQAFNEALSGAFEMGLLNFPMEDIHPLAVDAARMAVCGAHAKKFGSTLVYLFGPQYRSDKVDLDAFCAALEIDDCRAMKECVAAKRTMKFVRRDRRAGRAAGVRGTPALFIGGRKITPQRGGFSVAFLADIANRFFLRDWTLPAEASIARWIQAVAAEKAAEKAAKEAAERASAEEAAKGETAVEEDEAGELDRPQRGPASGQDGELPPAGGDGVDKRTRAGASEASGAAKVKR